MRATATRKVFTAERRAKEGHALPASPDGVSNGEILDAIERLGERLNGATAEPRADVGDDDPKIESATETANTELSEIRLQIAKMAKTIHQAKIEIAAIKHPLAEDDQMLVASNRLDSIVNATETATNDILDASEQVEDAIKRMVAVAPENAELLSLSEEAGGYLIKIMEACGFQDLTGQRIAKVVATLGLIEDRIVNIIAIWGADAFSEITAENQDGKPRGDGSVMHGPQDVGQGISQADIDALFD